MGARAIPPQEIQADLISNLLRKPRRSSAGFFFARFSVFCRDTDFRGFTGSFFAQIICVHLRPILDYRVVPFTSRSFFWFSCYWALRPLMCFANFTGAPPWRLTTGRSRHSSAGISVARSITKHESPNVRGTFVSIACILADIRIRLRAGFQVRGSPHPH